MQENGKGISLNDPRNKKIIIKKTTPGLNLFVIPAAASALGAYNNFDDGLLSLQL